MINWKNLKLNPPSDDCNVCVKVGVNYDTYQFKRYSDIGWDLIKNLKPIAPCKIPDHAMYIILDDIK